MNLYLDSNALVKLYHQEAGSEKLIKLLNKDADNLVLTIADIAKIEFHSAILKRVRKKEVSMKTAGGIFAAFEKDISMFNVVDVDAGVKNKALDLLKTIASKRGLSTLDSIQLATALMAHQVYPVDVFVTSDRLLFAVAKEYFNIFNPEATIAKTP